MRRIRKVIIPCYILLALTTGCAVRNAPQISPATRWELNTASLLQQNERDYRQFFTDVGNWQRAGQITPEQVAALNTIGVRLQLTLENANRLFRAWQNAPSEQGQQQVSALILEATQIFVELATRKAQIVTGGN